MTRVFWDTMLFIYYLQNHPTFGIRVRHLRSRAQQRGDRICTSSLAVGEIVTGLFRDGEVAEALRLRDALMNDGFEILPFGFDAIAPFGSIRSRYRTPAADAIHLACAAAAGVDLFLTGDKALLGLHIDGIKFIADINTDLL